MLPTSATIHALRNVFKFCQAIKPFIFIFRILLNGLFRIAPWSNKLIQNSKRNYFLKNNILESTLATPYQEQQLICLLETEQAKQSFISQAPIWTQETEGTYLTHTRPPSSENSRISKCQSGRHSLWGGRMRRSRGTRRRRGRRRAERFQQGATGA